MFPSHYKICWVFNNASKDLQIRKWTFLIVKVCWNELKNNKNKKLVPCDVVWHSFSSGGSGLTSEVSDGYNEWLHSYYGGFMSANRHVAKKGTKIWG